MTTKAIANPTICAPTASSSELKLTHALDGSPTSSVVTSRVRATAKVASTNATARSNSGWSRVKRTGAPLRRPSGHRAGSQPGDAAERGAGILVLVPDAQRAHQRRSWPECCREGLARGEPPPSGEV